MAESYGTEAAADIYHSDRGNTNWAGFTSAQKLEGLLVASEYIDQQYRSSFPGWKVGDRSQVREWPRFDAYDQSNDLIPSNAVPVEVERAVYEAALIHLDGTALLTDFTAGTDIREVSVDGAVSVKFAGSNNPDDAQTHFANVAAAIAAVLKLGTGGSNFGRFEPG